jgi:hypothetical protein
MYMVSATLLGTVPRGIFFTLGRPQSMSSGVQPIGPWIADLLGLTITLVLPLIGSRSRTSPTGDDQMDELQVVTSRNHFYAVIEEAIMDSIRKRMHSAVIEASKLYDWPTIKLAARRALDQELALSSITDKVHKSECKLIDSLPIEPNSSSDPKRKYEILNHLLRICQFRHLRFHLKAAGTEAHP